MQLTIMIILTLACCILASKYLDYAQRKVYKSALWMKVFASLCYVAVGVIAMLGCWYGLYGKLVLCGLILGLVGDVLLVLREGREDTYNTFLIAGGASLAAGFATYDIAFINLTPKVLYIAGPYLVVGLVLSLIYIKKQKFKSPGPFWWWLFYDAAALFTGGCAAGAGVYALSPGTVLFAVGGVFLSLSASLFYAEAFGSRHSYDRVRMTYILYYCAQMFAAYSMIMLFVM